MLIEKFHSCNEPDSEVLQNISYIFCNILECINDNG